MRTDSVSLTHLVEIVFYFFFLKDLRVARPVLQQQLLVVLYEAPPNLLYLIDRAPLAEESTEQRHIN